MLSATVGNAGAIADWLTTIRGRPCRVVAETQRPVPLYPMVLHPSGTLLPLTVKGKRGQKALHKRVESSHRREKKPEAPDAGGCPLWRHSRVLKAYDLLPAIFFLKSRSDCDAALNLCHGAVP
jgi:ATP-dependent RNA helicase HelY